MFKDFLEKLNEPKSVKWIGLSIFTIFTITLILLIPYFTKVFSGEWLLNQNLVRWRVDYISLFGWEVPVGDIAIRFYSLFFFLGTVAAFFLAVYLFKVSYLPGTLVDRLFIGIILFSIISARAFFVLSNLGFYTQNPEKILLIYEGGLSIFGGIIGGFLYTYFYVKRYRFNLWEILDILAPSLLLGQIIGRFGNFFNYEAYGAPTGVAWKMFVPEQAINGNKYVYDNQMSQYFHPTFLYEIIPNLFLFAFLMWKYPKWTYRNAGLIAGAYLIGYGLIRTFTEFFRLDALFIPANIKFAFPTWFTGIFENLFKNTIFVDPLIASLKNIEIEKILISQLVAILFVILGTIIYKKRREIVYSPEKALDLN